MHKILDFKVTSVLILAFNTGTFNLDICEKFCSKPAPNVYGSTSIGESAQ